MSYPVTLIDATRAPYVILGALEGRADSYADAMTEVRELGHHVIDIPGVTGLGVGPSGPEYVVAVTDAE